MYRVQWFPAAIFSLATLFFSAALCNRDESTDDPKFYNYSFPNPGFDSLETFVRENYGESLDAATLSTVKLDNRAAVSFWTTGQGSREFSILFAESDATWVLMTTAPLTF